MLAASAFAISGLGCGGDSSDDATGNGGDGAFSAADDRAAVKEAAQKSVDALWGEDPGSACDTFTDSYKARS